MFLKWLLSTRTAFPLFLVAVVVMYGVCPWIIDAFVRPHGYFGTLARLTFVGCIAMGVGYKLPLLDRRFAPDAWRLSVDGRKFHIVVWAAFLIFVLITFVTAPKIPLLSAIMGSSSIDELDQQRGAFLKMRQGYEAVLPYIGTMFLSVLIPYSLVHLLRTKARFRFVAAAGFVLFTISFLVKSLFLSVVLPVLYFVTRVRRGVYLRFSVVCALSIVLLLVLTRLAANVTPQDMLTADVTPQDMLVAGSGKGGSVTQDNVSPKRPANVEDAAPARDAGSGSFTAAVTARAAEVGAWAEAFTSMKYQPRSNLDFLVWRIVAVPIIAAADTLTVHASDLGGHPLLGGTSLILSKLFQVPRIPLERMVFAHQFRWNDLASSNAVFFCDAYANFLWFGVIFYGLFVGQSWRWFRLSNDLGFKALWPLYGFILFAGPLIGTLFSNGYALAFTFGLFCRLKRSALQDDVSVIVAPPGAANLG